MIKIFFWTIVFFLGAMLVAMQPACQKWDKNLQPEKIKLYE